MRCDNPGCNRVFRNGETVYAVPVHINIIRGDSMRFQVVEHVVCAFCWVQSGHTLKDIAPKASG